MRQSKTELFDLGKTSGPGNDTICSDAYCNVQNFCGDWAVM